MRPPFPRPVQSEKSHDPAYRKTGGQTRRAAVPRTPRHARRAAISARIPCITTIVRTARIAAKSGTGPLVMTIIPERGGRRLLAEAQDAGAVLRAADVMQGMSGGRLMVTGTYDDTTPSHQLVGTAEMTDAVLDSLRANPT